MIEVEDALGDLVRLDRPAARVISLIPSVTETLFALDRGSRVVGCTTYCVHPAEALSAVARIGGTKNPDLDAIRNLAPDLILANKEENRATDVARLRTVAPVHVSYPRDLAGLAGYLRALATLLDCDAAAARMIAGLDAARATFHAARADLPPRRCLYFIWRDPWMVAGADTFIDAMLRETGFENAAAGLRGRYPELPLSAVAALRPDVILLSSEPFAFEDRHRAEVAAGVGLAPSRVCCVSGEAFSWFGCRTAAAFDEARRVHRFCDGA